VRPVEKITAGWRGRMVECCAFLYTSVAAYALSWCSVGVVTSCWFSEVDVTSPPKPTRKNTKNRRCLSSLFFIFVSVTKINSWT